MRIKKEARCREDITWQVMDKTTVRVVNPSNPLARLFLKYNK
jgi:hypothetical protein